MWVSKSGGSMFLFWVRRYINGYLLDIYNGIFVCFYKLGIQEKQASTIIYPAQPTFKFLYPQNSATSRWPSIGPTRTEMTSSCSRLCLMSIPISFCCHKQQIFFHYSQQKIHFQSCELINDQNYLPKIFQNNQLTLFQYKNPKKYYKRTIKSMKSFLAQMLAHIRKKLFQHFAKIQTQTGPLPTTTTTTTITPPIEKPKVDSLRQVDISDVNGKEHKIKVTAEITGLDLKKKIFQEVSKSLKVEHMILKLDNQMEIEDGAKLNSYYHDGKIKQVKCRLSQTKIPISKEKDPLGIDQQVTKMPCGHVIGRDGMISFLDSILLEHRHKIKCPFVGEEGEICGEEWDFMLCREIGIFTVEENRKFQEGLNANWIRKYASECPNCHQKVVKQNISNNRVVCPNCQNGSYCLICSRKWKGPTNASCGNEDCSAVNIVTQSQWNKVFRLSGRQFLLPNLRACPNPDCHAPVNHIEGCKHMKCLECNTRFCWVCLEMFKKGAWPCGETFSYCGKMAPTQRL